MRSLIQEMSLALLLVPALNACVKDGSDPSASATRCEALANKDSIDESCAIEIAKEAIAKQQGKVVYSKFEAHFYEPDKMWVVMAIHEPPLPGGHVSVSIRLNGDVHEIYPGM